MPWLCILLACWGLQEAHGSRVVSVLHFPGLIVILSLHLFIAVLVRTWVSDWALGTSPPSLHVTSPSSRSPSLCTSFAPSSRDPDTNPMQHTSFQDCSILKQLPPKGLECSGNKKHSHEDNYLICYGIMNMSQIEGKLALLHVRKTAAFCDRATESCGLRDKGEKKQERSQLEK